MSWPLTLITFHHVKRTRAPKLIARSPCRRGVADRATRMSSCGLVGSVHASLAPARWLLQALNTGARTASRGVRRSASSWWPAASFAPDHAHPGGERAYGLAVGLPARSL